VSPKIHGGSPRWEIVELIVSSMKIDRGVDRAWARIMHEPPSSPTSFRAPCPCGSDGLDLHFIQVNLLAKGGKTYPVRGNKNYWVGLCDLCGIVYWLR
jgi:hypothetical protein